METFTYFWSVSWLMWVIKLFSFSQKNLMKKGQRRAPKSHRERASHFLPAQLVVYSTGPGALGGHPLVDSSQLVTTQEAHGGYSPRDDNRFSQTQNVSHTQDPKSNPPWDPWLLCRAKGKPSAGTFADSWDVSTEFPKFKGKSQLQGSKQKNKLQRWSISL
jgi:hypothetical protein